MTIFKSFVVLLSVIIREPETTRKFAVPPIVRLPPDCVIDCPEINVRFVPSVTFDRSIGAVLTIAPVELLPMVSVPAVMLLISVFVRPKFPVDFVPRSTAVPEVGISSTEPDEVALTVLPIVRF